ncbi:hypothetical protein RYX36_007293 [Vicia faba]
MSSFSVEEFIGNGVLKELLQKLLEEGWDDVPTLKIMGTEDMDLIYMTQKQKEVLGMRCYLHDKGVMQYADKMEESGENLLELLKLSSNDLVSKFEMKRGHVARFINKTRGDDSLKLQKLPLRRKTSIVIHGDDSIIPKSNVSNYTSSNSSTTRSNTRSNAGSDEQSMIKDGYVFKGIVASEPAELRACGCLKPPQVSDQVANYCAVENISVQKLTPEYKIGMEPLLKFKTPPLKASELWRNKPAVFLCLRRPGCIMCRAEAHQLYLRKPVFDSLGVQLFVVLHEDIESEVKDFWPRYWGGVVVLDRSMDFYKALGGGKLLKENFISGFLLNPKALSNYKRSKSMNIEYNFKGEGEIKGGLFIIGSGKSGIAYQFIERNFGDWAPLAEVIEICTQMQKVTRG